jgi:hypothetical protein
VPHKTTPVTVALTRTEILQNKWVQGALIAIGLFIIYFATGNESSPYNQYVLLADSFLCGRLAVDLTHVSSVFFMMAALVTARGQKRAWLVGLLLGLSGVSRLATFLHVSLRRCVAQVPSHRHPDHLRWEAETGKPDLGAGTRARRRRISQPSRSRPSADATVHAREGSRRNAGSSTPFLRCYALREGIPCTTSAGYQGPQQDSCRQTCAPR